MLIKQSRQLKLKKRNLNGFFELGPMKTQTNIFSTTPDLSLRMLLQRSLKATLNGSQQAPAPRLTSSEEFLPQQKIVSTFILEDGEAPFVYVVDNEPHLTELYTIILDSKGCFVRPFSDRVQALAALEHEGRKPDLLIIDSLGNSVLADQFMNLCLAVCPGLRILMASGLSQSDVHFSSVKPVRFLQKPFTPEEFLSEVRVALNHKTGSPNLNYQPSSLQAP